MYKYEYEHFIKKMNRFPVLLVPYYTDYMYKLLLLLVLLLCFEHFGFSLFVERYCLLFVVARSTCSL